MLGHMPGIGGMSGTGAVRAIPGEYHPIEGRRTPAALGNEVVAGGRRATLWRNIHGVDAGVKCHGRFVGLILWCDVDIFWVP